MPALQEEEIGQGNSLQMKSFVNIAWETREKPLDTKQRNINITALKPHICSKTLNPHKQLNYFQTQNQSADQGKAANSTK